MGIFNTDQEKKVFEVLNKHVESLGFELLRIRTFGSSSSKKLQLMISNLNGNPVTINDCENVSNHVSVLLDVENPLNCEFDLEVSSPGLDRPLVKIEHFKSVLNKKVNIQTKFYIKNRKNFKAKLTNVGDDKVSVFVEDVKETFEIPYDAISDANLIYEDEVASSNKKNRRK